jgi:hypothetical protein
MRITLMLAAAAMGTSVASAQFMTEVESNNTLATANSIGNFTAPGGSMLVDGTIVQGDVDWFSFTLDNTASLAVFAAFSTGAGADGVMQLVDAAGVVIGFNDDDGIGLMPALQAESLAAGTYYIGLSGFGDQGAASVGTTNIFTGGNHDENFAYKLTFGFTVIPAPGALAMLGFGGALMARRRR